MNQMLKQLSGKRSIAFAYFALVLLYSVIALFACTPVIVGETEIQARKQNVAPSDNNSVPLPALSDDILNLDGNPDPDEEVPDRIMSHSEDYKKYRDSNSDVVGWISIPNTRIEYPVTRTDDNEYYLTNNVDKEKSKSGAVFMDFRNTDPLTARHVLLYGHNMRNGTMFHDLNSYKVKDFFENNRDITMHVGDKAVKYEIYAAFVISADLNFMEVSFKDDETFLTYANILKDMSKFKAKPSVKLMPSDQILTLVTCTYEYDDSRFAIQARRVS